MQIAKILRDKMNYKFKGEIKDVYESRFRNFSPMEFRALLDISHIRVDSKGATLIEEDSHLDAILYIISGHCDVVVKGVTVATLNSHDFVGEMSFLTGSKTTADVVCATQVRYIFWEKEKLFKKLFADPHLLHRFEGAIGLQLIEKLKQESQKRANLKLVS